MAIRYVIAAGGYRTGSTYLYNLVGVYLTLTQTGHRVGFGGMAELGKVPVRGIGVVKSHYLGGWESLVRTGEALPLITTRDPHERHESMRRFFGQNQLKDRFNETALNEDLWDVVISYTRNGLYVDYDDLIASPGSELLKIAWYLFDSVDGAAVDEAVERTAKGAIPLPRRGTEPDPITQLHWNHFTS